MQNGDNGAVIEQKAAANLVHRFGRGVSIEYTKVYEVCAVEKTYLFQ